MHGLSCSAACGIFLDQGLNPCLPHWQVNSLPLRHREPQQLIVDKSAKTFQWKEEVFLANDTEVNWLHTWTPTLTTYININSEWIICISVRISTLKLLEENLRVDFDDCEG